MNNANHEWNEHFSKQKKMTNFQTGAQRFSVQKNTDQMLQNLLQGNVERVKDQLNCLPFPPGSTVLDIGAGPGTLAVPLAAAGCNVTVVEPAPPMHAALAEYKKVKGVDADISIIPKVWEDVSPDEIGQFDYVVSSFAMSVPDLKDALLKMNDVARKEVHIFWFLTDPPWGRISEALWTKLHGEDYYGRPLADLVWNALYQTGIYASLEVLPLKDSHYYESFEEALDEYVDRLAATEDWQIRLVEDYLKEQMTEVSGKGLVLPEDGLYAHIWWKK
ncbi:ubiquinone/menaquinone biosynthesis C-methylase UbiE [Methanimicrococcus blatticola]|uniref:Ubiquinone/menaquinone biosynthesis C-methylase UbiE n=2 Tax=Methanimicrococcus blatticola TaxID=91560 RepID=A0A484F540_9EURY|nr:ubiquinone/menaquinone biosynthesis C-methylase UbiE [Methanimicrococcus blatticola]